MRSALDVLVLDRHHFALFLRLFNPLISLTVMELCFVASCTAMPGCSPGPRTVVYVGFFKSPFHVYYLGMGVGCAAVLFVLGKAAQGLLPSPDDASGRPPRDGEE
jgi:hypothetical protein